MKFLVKTAIKLVIVLVIAIVGYNFFAGTPDERANAKALLSKVKGLGQDVFGLLSSEKEKYDQGKYDDAMSKISSAYETVKNQASKLADGGSKWMEQLNSIEEQKKELEAQLEKLRGSSADSGGNGNMTSSNPGYQLNADSSYESSSYESSSYGNSGSSYGNSNDRGFTSDPAAMTVVQIKEKMRQLAKQTEDLATQMGNDQ